MNRPASYIVPAFLMGALVANDIPVLPRWLLLVMLIGAGWTILKAGLKGFVLGCLLLALVAGVFRWQLLNRQESDWGTQMIFSHQGPQLLLEGRVTDVQALSGHQVRYRVTVKTVTTEKQTVRVQVPVLLVVRDYQGIGTLIPPGTRVWVKDANVTHDLRGTQEEGYLQHWKAQGLKAVLETTSEGMVAQGVVNPVHWWAYRVRKHGERVMDSLVAEPENRVLKSLFFGNQGYLTTPLRHLFTTTGTAHLMAVSGLHVGIMSLFSQWLMEKAGAGKKASKVVTTLLVWFYAAMAGFPLSIIRAATMYTLYSGAFFSQRRYDAKSILLWCGMGFVWLNPYTLYTISFQLSFGAVASLLWLYPRVLSKLTVSPPPWLKLLLVTLTAQLGTWPVIAWHFGTFSGVSLLTNLLIVPFIGIIMPLALVMTVTGFFSSTLAMGMGIAVEGGLKYILWVVTRLSQHPWAELTVPRFNPAWIILYYLMLAGLAWGLKKEPAHQAVCTGKERYHIGEKCIDSD